MVQFAVVMAVLVLFVVSLVGGLELVDILARRAVGGPDPEKLLAQRFAKGEIDEGEYARRLAILRYGPPLELPD